MKLVELVQILFCICISMTQRDNFYLHQDKYRLGSLQLKLKSQSKICKLISQMHRNINQKDILCTHQLSLNLLHFHKYLLGMQLVHKLYLDNRNLLDIYSLFTM